MRIICLYSYVSIPAGRSPIAHMESLAPTRSRAVCYGSTIFRLSSLPRLVLSRVFTHGNRSPCSGSWRMETSSWESYSHRNTLYRYAVFNCQVALEGHTSSFQLIADLKRKTKMANSNIPFSLLFKILQHSSQLAHNLPQPFADCLMRNVHFICKV